MSRYIPMPAYPDMMPVDISFVFEDEKPAGKHGFCKAEGESLVFEDGTPARFWGVNVNGGACFPDHDYAKKFARRLAQSGCNIVRFHQLDAEWDTPNIFAYSKGKRVTTTRKLDPQSMDCLDYVIHCLKEEGIYTYLDMNTYRKFKEGDGVLDPQYMCDEGKPWCMIDPYMIDLQKEFATQIWTHVNPYTGLAYKDEPAIVLSEIVNECDLIDDTWAKRNQYKETDVRLKQLRQILKEYLEERGLEYDWENGHIWSVHEEPILGFKIYLMQKFFQEMHDHMRSIGVKIPITGTNWSRSGYGIVKASEDLDFMDGHHYFYDWRWGNTERICKNSNITGTPVVFPNLARMVAAGKPYFISEWDMPWPNSYRAEGAIYYAAVGALQGWSGFTIHTYAYSTRLDKMDILGRELSSPVAGVPYREGIFSTWNDPAKFGLFYHSALMLRRADVSPAKKKIAVAPAELGKTSMNAWNTGLEQHKLGVCLGDMPADYDEKVLDSESIPHPVGGMITSDTGELWRDLRKQIAAVDTPRTKVVYGMLNRAQVGTTFKKIPAGIELDGLGVTCKTDFGVIALSSLTDEPLDKTDNILLSAIGRARNTDAIFDGEKMLDAGRAPIMAEVIDAQIALKTEHGDHMKVWGVNAEGFYAGLIPTTYEDGYLKFRIGDEQNPACYYLIVKE